MLCDVKVRLSQGGSLPYTEYSLLIVKRNDDNCVIRILNVGGC